LTKGIKHIDVGQQLAQAEWESEDIHELASGTSFPETPSEKDRYYRSDEHKWYIYNGTEWKALGEIDISDADATVGDVKSPKTFYSMEEPRKTGTMPTVDIVAANDNYPEGYHAGNVGGLDAIDADLAPVNIKKDVNIFGKVGTLEPIAEAQSVTQPTTLDGFVIENTRKVYKAVPADSEVTLVTKTDTFSSLSRAVAGYGAMHEKDSGYYMKIRLYMDNVQVAESGGISSGEYIHIAIWGDRVLSGSKTIHVTAYNYDTSTKNIYWQGANIVYTSWHPILIIGSCKL